MQGHLQRETSFASVRNMSRCGVACLCVCCHRTRSRGCEAVLGPVWQSEHVSACAVIACVFFLLQKKPSHRPNSLRHWANRCVAATFAIHRQSPAVGSSTLCTHYRGLDACVKRQDLQGMVWTSLLMIGPVDCLVRIVVTVRAYHLQLLQMCPAICNKKPDYVCARTRPRGCEAMLGPIWQSEQLGAFDLLGGVLAVLEGIVVIAFASIKRKGGCCSW